MTTDATSATKVNHRLTLLKEETCLFVPEDHQTVIWECDCGDKLFYCYLVNAKPITVKLLQEEAYISAFTHWIEHLDNLPYDVAAKQAHYLTENISVYERWYDLAQEMIYGQGTYTSDLPNVWETNRECSNIHSSEHFSHRGVYWTKQILETTLDHIRSVGIYHVLRAEFQQGI